MPKPLNPKPLKPLNPKPSNERKRSSQAVTWKPMKGEPGSFGDPFLAGTWCFGVFFGGFCGFRVGVWV